MTAEGIKKGLKIAIIAMGVVTISKIFPGLELLLGSAGAAMIGDAVKGWTSAHISKSEKIKIAENVLETNSNLKENNKDFNEIYNNMLENIQDPFLKTLVKGTFSPENMEKYDGSKLLRVQLLYLEKTIDGSSLTVEEKRNALSKLVDFCKDYNEKVEKTPDRIEQRKSDPDGLILAERQMGNLVATYWVATEFKNDFSMTEFESALLKRGVTDLLDTKQYDPDVLKVVLKDLGVDVKRADQLLADKNLMKLQDPNEVRVPKDELQSMVDKLDEVIKGSDELIKEADATILSYEEFEKRRAESGNTIKHEGEVEVVDRNNGKGGDDSSDKKKPESGENKNKDAVDADFSDYRDYGE